MHITSMWLPIFSQYITFLSKLIQYNNFFNYNVNYTNNISSDEIGHIISPKYIYLAKRASSTKLTSEDRHL